MQVQGKQGYVTTTYKMKLYPKHLDWLALTKERYNQVLAFYYHILMEQKDLLTLSNQNVLRQLEIITLGEKKKEVKAINPIPYEKVPVYFRRAAINGAISMVRSHIQREKTAKGDSNVNLAKQFQSSPVYYKGMYKEFNKEYILLKLWNGTSWVWVKYRFQKNNRTLPETAVCMSPSLKIDKRSVYLHVPVVFAVKDVRKVTERIEEKELICSVYFPNGNHLAVCIVIDSDGRFIKSYFIGKGKEWKHRRKYYQNKIQSENEKISRNAKEKLHNISEDYAHKVSREIITFCAENNVKVLVVPNYKNKIPLKDKRYLQITKYDWIGPRIIRYLDYKAFKEGIVMTKLMPFNIVKNCSLCGEKVKRYNEGHQPNENYYGGKLFFCSNHHKGNTSFNAARNLGNYFIDKCASYAT